MPVLEVRTPDKNEFELPPIVVPAQLAGVIYELTDLARTRGRQNLRYVNLTVSNGSPGNLTLRDQNGREFPVGAGQTVDWDLEEPGTYLTVSGDQDISAKQVTLVARVLQVA